MGIPPNLITTGSDDSVAAWVIIVPIVVAIIIIVVVAILLYFVSYQLLKLILFSILYIKFGFFKRKKVGEDEEDLAKWQSPNNGDDETIPQNKGSTPASEDPTT